MYCVISQKLKRLNYTAAEVRNLSWLCLLREFHKENKENSEGRSYDINDPALHFKGLLN
jgi:hypothetical protein